MRGGARAEGAAYSGNDLLVAKADGGSGVARHPSAPGRFQHGSIPGYTGHVQGRIFEDVHGATHSRASTHIGTSPDFMRGRIDRGSLNASVASVDQGGFHASIGISGATPPPECSVVSTFHNPKGHGPRSGAAVPGYAGFIPGKYAGNIFAKRCAMSNVQATQARQANHSPEVELGKNWIVASEADRRQHAHGAAWVGEQWRFSTAPPARAASSGPRGWRLHEPAATHEWLRY